MQAIVENESNPKLLELLKHKCKGAVKVAKELYVQLGGDEKDEFSGGFMHTDEPNYYAWEHAIFGCYLFIGGDVKQRKYFYIQGMPVMNLSKEQLGAVTAGALLMAKSQN